MLRRAWERGLNCPRTSSAGRLFDAAAALLGLVSRASFEAQAPMALEAACSGEGHAVALPLWRRDGLWVSDWEPLLDLLRDARLPVGERAATFHATLANIVLDQARAVRAAHGVSRIGLTGGVFQNRLLCERAARLAQEHGFVVVIPERVPCNDAGLSFGQLVEAGAVVIDGQHVTLAHGNGGRFMRELIEEVFVRTLPIPTSTSAATRRICACRGGARHYRRLHCAAARISGGDIGSLAVPAP